MTILEIKALNPYVVPGLMYKEIDPMDYAEMIISHVGRKFHLSASDMKRNTRKRHIVKPRQIAMYLIYDKLFGKLSLKQIGEIFGGKDHTTVIFAIHTVKGRMKVDSDFNNFVMELKK